MSKKEESFCFFTSCFRQPGQQDEVVVASNDELRWRSTKNEGKISLKQAKHSSIHSSLIPPDQRSIQRNHTQKPNQNGEYTKENRFLSTNRTFNSPCERREASKMPLNGILIKTASNNSNTKKIGLTSPNELKKRAQESRQLQKTTRLFPQNSKQSLKSSHLRHLELQQTKILKKTNMLSKLDSYKQSVVSINNENESIHEKLEESMIMIDYFHPSHEKALELQHYLVNRS